MFQCLLPRVFENFYHILTPFISVWLPPVSCKATFSSVSASMLQDKTHETVPEVPSWPHLPLYWWLLPSSDEKAMMFTAHCSWMDFRFPPPPPPHLCFIFFSLSLSVSASGWWGERSWSGGWGVGGGWGEASSWAGMTRLVRCVCVSVFFFFCVNDATVAQTAWSFHIFRWLLHIIQSSQLLLPTLGVVLFCKAWPVIHHHNLIR